MRPGVSQLKSHAQPPGVASTFGMRVDTSLLHSTMRHTCDLRGATAHIDILQVWDEISQIV